MSSVNIKCKSEGCTETFNHRMKLKRHLDSGKCKGVRKQNKFTKNENDHLVCQKCHTLIKHYSDTTRHVKSCPGGPKNADLFAANKNDKGRYQCSLCVKTFLYHSYQKGHIKTHEGLSANM